MMFVTGVQTCALPIFPRCKINSKITSCLGQLVSDKQNATKQEQLLRTACEKRDVRQAVIVVCINESQGEETANDPNYC